MTKVYLMFADYTRAYCAVPVVDMRTYDKIANALHELVNAGVLKDYQVEYKEDKK